MSRRRPPALKLLSIAMLAAVPALSAQAAPQSQDRGRDQQRDEHRGNGSRSSLSDAVRRVERDTRGEVLSAERVQYDGRDMHRVKVVDDQGRVRVFMQDPHRRHDAGNAPPPSRNEAGAPSRRPPARDDND
jgi:hypothetical protein